MATDTSALDKMQSDYKAAVHNWIVAIKEEEALASAKSQRSSNRSVGASRVLGGGCER
jgi:hypothetical protein